MHLSSELNNNSSLVFSTFHLLYHYLPWQVAHFYNTIDRQMIPSQQSMMLDAAMAFEHIIKNPKAGAKTSTEVHFYYKISH